MAKEHHRREYVIAGLGLAAEFAAVKYGISWLAWLAALFFWLAFFDYTKRYRPWGRYVLRFLSAAIIFVGTYFLTVEESKKEASQRKTEATVNEIARMFEEGGGSQQLLAKYPLGYV